MTQRYSNDAASELTGSITSAAGQVVNVTAGHGAKFPVAAGDDRFTVLLDDGTNKELAEATRSVDAITLQSRAIEPVAGVQTAFAFGAATKIAHVLTLASLRRLPGFDDPISFAEGVEFQGPISMSGTYDSGFAVIFAGPTQQVSGTDNGIFVCFASIEPTAAVADFYGMLFIPTIIGVEGVTTKTITSLYGAFVRLDTAAAYDSLITGGYGYYADYPWNLGGNAGMTNWYAFYTATPSSVAKVTNAYAFYAAGSAKSYFGGEVELDGPFNHDGSTYGVFGVTPTTRPAAYTQTYATATRTHSNPTATALTNAFGTADGTIQDATASHNQSILNNNFRECTDRINQLIADLANVKQVVNQVLDDFQLQGHLQ